MNDRAVLTARALIPALEEAGVSSGDVVGTARVGLVMLIVRVVDSEEADALRRDLLPDTPSGVVVPPNLPFARYARVAKAHLKLIFAAWSDIANESGQDIRAEGVFRPAHAACGAPLETAAPA